MSDSPDKTPTREERDKAGIMWNELREKPPPAPKFMAEIEAAEIEQGGVVGVLGRISNEPDLMAPEKKLPTASEFDTQDLLCEKSQLAHLFTVLELLQERHRDFNLGMTVSELTELALNRPEKIKEQLAKKYPEHGEKP